MEQADLFVKKNVDHNIFYASISGVAYNLGRLPAGITLGEDADGKTFIEGRFYIRTTNDGVLLA